jgi:hypothetical protein
MRRLGKQDNRRLGALRLAPDMLGPCVTVRRAIVLGLSLTKILVTILIAVAVWRSFAFIGRLAREREARAVGNARQQRATARGSGTIELIECSRCGAYFDPRQGCRCGHRPA